jgi:hypothetical protein
MAYGDNRSEVFNDTFDSSIDGNYENGGGDWDVLTWVSGGVIRASAGAFASCAMRRTTTVNDDQYCQVVSATQSGDTYTACVVRMAAGTDESSYIGYSAHFELNYQIWESDSAFRLAVALHPKGRSVYRSMVHLEVQFNDPICWRFCRR